MKKLLLGLFFSLISVVGFSQPIYSWRFENNGNAEKGSVNLSAVSSPTYTTTEKEGTYGGSVNNNSGNRFVTSSDLLLEDSYFGLSFWALTGNNNSNTRVLFDNRTNGTGKGMWCEVVTSTGVITVYTNNGTTTGSVASANSAFTPAWDTYVHIFIRMIDLDQSYLKIYVNGVASVNAGNDTTIQSGWYEDNPWAFGSSTSGGSTLYGYIDNVQFYNCYLTDTKIDYLYDNGTTYTETTCPTISENCIDNIDNGTFTATWASANSSDLVWSDISCENKYYVYMSTNGGAYSLKDSTVANDGTITINGLNNINSYCFRIYAANTTDTSTVYLQDCISGTIIASNWYLDATNGNDSNSGHNSSLAFKTIAKLQSYINLDSIAPGDSILFKRGEIWNAAVLSLDGIDGTVSNPIVISSYGIGVKPILDGFKVMTGFNETSTGSHIWRITDATLPGNHRAAWVENGTSDKEHHFPFAGPVLINGIASYPGIYPNSGFLEAESRSYISTYWVQDNQANWSGNQWLGGHASVGVCDWIQATILITSNSNNRLNLDTHWDGYSLESAGDMNSTPPFRIMNHINTLDLDGEYYWNYASQQISIYYNGNLNSQSVKMISGDTVLYINNCNNIIVEELDCRGGLNSTIFVQHSDSITIDECNISYAGSTGILAVENSNLNIQYNTVEKTENAGITNLENTNTNIQFNYVKRIGLQSIGMNRDYAAVGIINSRAVDSSNILYNRIDSISYSGMQVLPNGEINTDILVYGNAISNWSMWKTDGGAIYTLGSRVTPGTSLIMRKNIIYKVGSGSANVVMTMAAGLYFDEHNDGFLVDSNTIYDASPGIRFHGVAGVDDMTVLRNLVVKPNASAFTTGDYDNACINIVAADGNGSNRIRIEHNYLVTTDNNSSGLLWHERCINCDPPITYYTYPRTTGSTMNNNHFYTPMRTDTKVLSFMRWYSPSSKTYNTPSEWYALYGFENNSVVNENNWRYSDVSGIPQNEFVKVFMNASLTSRYFKLGDCTFVTLQGADISDSVLVAPYRSECLFYKSGNIYSIDPEFYWDNGLQEETTGETIRGYYFLRRDSRDVVVKRDNRIVYFNYKN